MAQERTSVDDAIVNGTYFFISAATYLMETMHKATKKFCLDEEFTPEMKKGFKRDLGFTSDSILRLRNAQNSYRTMMGNLERIEEQFNDHVAKGGWDMGMASMLDILSVVMVYMILTDGDLNTEKRIHNYLIRQFKWPDDLKATYQTIRNNMAIFRR